MRIRVIKSFVNDLDLNFFNDLFCKKFYFK